MPQISELASQGIPAYRTDHSRGNQWHLVNIAIDRTPAGIEATGIAQPARLSAGSVFNPISLVVLKAGPLTLEQIAKYPIITHDPSFSGRWRVMDAFKNLGLAPDFLSGIVDADASKAYVERDLGIAMPAIDGDRPQARLQPPSARHRPCVPTEHYLRHASQRPAIYATTCLISTKRSRQR